MLKIPPFAKIGKQNRELNTHFIVLPRWSIMPQTLDIPHPVTLSWPVLALPLSLSAKRGAASTIFNEFGMLRPGIKTMTSCSQEEQSLYLLSYRGRFTYSAPPGKYRPVEAPNDMAFMTYPIVENVCYNCDTKSPCIFCHFIHSPHSPPPPPTTLNTGL